MKIHEYQAKEILRRFGVPTPRGEMVTNAEDARKVAQKLGVPVVVVKANDIMVKTAEPRQTKDSVRRPAGFSRRCLSPPTSIPHTTAARARSGSTQNAGPWAYQLSHNQE